MQGVAAVVAIAAAGAVAAAAVVPSFSGRAEPAVRSPSLWPPDTLVWSAVWPQSAPGSGSPAV